MKINEVKERKSILINDCLIDCWGGLSHENSTSVFAS